MWNELLTNIATGISAVLFSLASVISPSYGTFNFVSSDIYTLSAPVNSTQTTIAVDNFLKPVSGQQYSMSSDFGSIGYMTLEPGSVTKKEFISFTGFSYTNNRATLTGVTRGLEFNSPYTASSTLRQSHGGGSKAVISNPPQLYNQLATKQNAETITGVWTFASTSWPLIDVSDADPSTDGQFATKKYVDDTAFSGASVINASLTARGISEIATQLETASSTPTGSTGAIVVVPASNATSTYNSQTAALRVVVTQNNGKIDNGFIATSTMYTNQNFSVGTTSMSGSLTLSGNNSISNIASTSIKTYTASTTPTTTWTKPTNLKYIIVKVQGGGGGGAGAATNESGGGAGGGGGGYCEKIIPAAALSATETIAVGGGGTAGADGSANATNGGQSYFGTHCVANGGVGAEGDTIDTPGTGGTATGGDITRTGQTGGPSASGASGEQIPAGVGGDSVLGFGGSSRSSDGTGNAGVAYGAGGAGGFCDNSCSANAGGAGAVGAVYVWEVYY